MTRGWISQFLPSPPCPPLRANRRTKRTAATLLRLHQRQKTIREIARLRVRIIRISKKLLSPIVSNEKASRLSRSRSQTENNNRPTNPLSRELKADLQGARMSGLIATTLDSSPCKPPCNQA